MQGDHSPDTEIPGQLAALQPMLSGTHIHIMLVLALLSVMKYDTRTS